jgi:3-oxoacyl-[acyl-carrier protein] reductase
MDLNLKDKVVIVTGGAAGIGRATVERFESEGARAVVWDVTGEGRVDVTNREAVEAAANDVAAKYGRIDVLVNNAGITRDAQLIKVKDGEIVSTMDDAAFDAVINVNLRAVFVCTRAVVPHMIKGGGGVILNASSIVGIYGNFGQTNYAATKFGVIGMMKTWARELGRKGIRANAICPGFIETPILTSIPDKVIKMMEEKVPLGRLGKPEEIANTYAWLASDEASYINGAVIEVSGGCTI